MTSLLDYCPAAPEWRLAWDDMDGEFPWLADLAGCPQDPVYHAEGDVWVHTRMVCEELLALDAWRSLPEPERRLLFAAAVLHDVGKPDCTRIEGERITSRGHSRRGAVLARGILWRMAVPFAVREAVCALIRYHQAPYYLIDRPDAERLAIEISQTARCDHLRILAEADVRGRICDTRQRLLDNVALFEAQVSEIGCLHAPFAFPSDQARVLYFRDEKRHPLSPTRPDYRGDVVLMSGLPGAGKDHHIRTHLADCPVVSLDAVREEMGVRPEDEQGAVVNAARERAREHLRRGERFVWNGTNVSRQLRGQVLDLLLAYEARVTIAYVEAPAEELFAQNRERAARVPEVVLGKLFDRWEVPDRTEAHAVEYHVRD
jgi:putative nucleotidyltransferase with HDIG domain